MMPLARLRMTADELEHLQAQYAAAESLDADYASESAAVPLCPGCGESWGGAGYYDDCSAPAGWHP